MAERLTSEINYYWERFVETMETTTLIHPAAAKSLQSCPTLCDPIGSSPPGSPVPGILQARTLEWVAIAFSNAGKRKVKVKSLSRAQLYYTLNGLLSLVDQW